MEKYHYIPDEEVFDNKYTHSEYWPPRETVACPYETEGEMVADMVTYAIALLGVRYILEPEETLYINEEIKLRAIGMAEMIGLYDRETNKVSLSHADIQQLYPQFRTKGLV